MRINETSTTSETLQEIGARPPPAGEGEMQLAQPLRECHSLPR